MRHVIRFISMAVVVYLLTVAIVFAQATGQISGRVTDATGAVLPGVDLTVTQTETGLARNTLTNEVGTYTFPSLAVGPYRLEVSAPQQNLWVKNGKSSIVESADPIETRKGRGFQQDLEKASKEKPRLFHTSNNADDGEQLQTEGNPDGTGTGTG